MYVNITHNFRINGKSVACYKYAKSRLDRTPWTPKHFFEVGAVIGGSCTHNLHE